MALARVRLAGGDEDARAVGREARIVDLEPSGGEGAWGGVVQAARVEMLEAGRLGQEPDVPGVDPAVGLAGAEAGAHPGVVVLVVQHAAPAGLGVDQHQPAVLVVGRAHRGQGRAAVG
jgi:hypothetical protein